MNKNHIVIPTILGMVLSLIAMLVSFGPSFYKYRSTSTQYYGDYHHTAKGDWNFASLSEASPVIIGFIVISTLVAIGISIPVLISAFNRRGPRGLFFGQGCALLFLAGVGFGVVISMMTLSHSSTSGVAGAWTSHGTNYELGANGGWFMFLTVCAQVLFTYSDVNGFIKGDTI